MNVPREQLSESFSDMHHEQGLTPAQKEKLFEEQRNGYAKLCALANAGGSKVEILLHEPLIILVPYSVVTEVCGEQAAENARAGGPLIIGCSDGRFVVTPDSIRLAKNRGFLPNDFPENAVKAGYPGLGALVEKDERKQFYDGVQTRSDIVLEVFHEDCGACNGNRNVAERLATELHDNALNVPIASAGYSENCTFRMTGYPHFHEELSMAIAGADNFAAERFPIARHMQLAAHLEPSDRTLNMHVQKLFGILMGHGWGPERSRKHPIVVMVAGSLERRELSASRMIERLQPTWQQLHEKFPGTFKVVAFDVP